MFEVIGIIVSIWFVALIATNIKPLVRAYKAKLEFDAFMAKRMADEGERHAR